MSATDKLNYYVNSLDKELNKYPALVNLEKQSQVPKAYAVLGLLATFATLIFFNIWAGFLSNLLGWGLPAYFSLRALDTPGTSDDKQWLTYWVVFGLLNLVENLISVTYWMPFYFTFKSFAILYLALPQTRGAEFIYAKFLRGSFASAKPTAAPDAHVHVE